MATGVRPLGDYDVCAAAQRLPGIAQCLDLADQRHTGVPDRWRKGRRIAKGQEQSRRIAR